MRTINREIVSAVILSSDGKIFMGKKDPNKGGVYIDCWHIPGGGVDEGETFEQALHREVLEETGIDIAEAKVEQIDLPGSGESEKTLDTGEKVLVKMNFNRYTVQLDTPAELVNVNLTDDLVEYRWVSKEEMKDLKLAPPSVELFKYMAYL
jgi:8-oxo-dGTP pyrophosphatase MutT (NUDIX family)